MKIQSWYCLTSLQPLTQLTIKFSFSSKSTISVTVLFSVFPMTALNLIRLTSRVESREGSIIDPLLFDLDRLPLEFINNLYNISYHSHADET